MRPETVEALLTLGYVVPAFVMMGYGMWVSGKVRGRAGWAMHRTFTLLALFWPLWLVPAVVYWCWKRLTQSRGAL